MQGVFGSTYVLERNVNAMRLSKTIVPITSIVTDDVKKCQSC